MSKERIALRWDVHEAQAPHDSDRWAASDRGWLFAEITPAPMTINVTGSTYVCLGHYLDYGWHAHDLAALDVAREADGESVHAVSCVTASSTHVATPAEARAWIEAEARGRVPGHFARCHQGYEHRKEEIRKMACADGASAEGSAS